MKVPFTREHGAYGMAITSFVIGSVIGGRLMLATFTTIAGILLLIMAKFPVQMLFQRRSIDVQLRKKFALWGFIFTHSGLLFFLPIYHKLSERALLVVAIFAISHLILYFLLMLLRKERTIFAEVIGISALSLSGTFGYYASSGADSQTAILIWMLSSLYYTASIFKVRSMLFMEGRDFYRRLSLIYPIFCVIIISGLAMVNLIQFSVLLSLLPLLDNILVQFKKGKIDIRKTGWLEVAKSAVFGIILILTLR